MQTLSIETPAFQAFCFLCGTNKEKCPIMKRNQTEFLKLCLADSLIKLMADKPYEDISINAICEKADVGRTTFTVILITRAAKMT